MPATHIRTPHGQVPIRKERIEQFAQMSDQQIIDETFRRDGVDPEAFAEMLDRRLLFRGDCEIYTELAVYERAVTQVQPDAASTSQRKRWWRFWSRT